MALTVIVLLVVACLLWRFFRPASSHHICANCGTRTDGKTVTRGSILIEIVLWICFLIPGLIYSIWRLTSRHTACGKCGSANLLPLDTPAGRELAARYPETATPSMPP